MLKKTEYNIKIDTLVVDNLCKKIVLNQPTGDFFYDPWILKNEFKNTVWEEILLSLPIAHGEARIINLSPGTTYMAHADIDDRWHLNLQGQESYLIDLTNKELYKLEKDGFWYEMNAGNLHVASNFGSIDRIQVVVRKLLIKTTADSLMSVEISPNYAQHDYRYKFDTFVSPWLNYINKQGLMKDFTVSGETVNFKISTHEISNMKLPENFKVVIKNEY